MAKSETKTAALRYKNNSELGNQYAGSVPNSPAPAAATPTIQVLERMFTLIDVLASRDEAMSLKEISQKTGLHPSTTHRILNDLTLGRYVDRPEAGSYRLGMRLLELGNAVKSRLDVREAALVPMRELHKQIQQPVNLSMRQGDEIVYIERAYSERSGMQVVRAIGGRAPLHLTSVGKLFLAVDDAVKVRAYASRTGLTGQTKTSLTDIHLLERELSRVRQYGTARDNEELEIGVRCMAAGVYDDQNKLVAGLSISAPADRIDEAWLAKLQATAAEISTSLGYKGKA
jgi:IclR family transcriptional regulator, carbohydrate utilization repressor